MNKLLRSVLGFIFIVCAFSVFLPYSLSRAATDDIDAIIQRSDQRRTAIAQMMETSTVFIMTLGDNISMGTGFIVQKDYVLTNAHVVEGGESFYIVGKSFAPIKAKVVKQIHSGSDDFAVLHFNSPQNLPVLSFNLNLGRTDKVSAWGYPYLVTKFDDTLQQLLDGDYIAAPPIVYTEGTVSAFIRREGGEAIIHTAAIAGGNSGGPLINNRGEVVGINTWGATDEDEGAFVNASLPASAAIRFLRSCNIEPLIADSSVQPSFGNTAPVLASGDGNSSSSAPSVSFPAFSAPSSVAGSSSPISSSSFSCISDISSFVEDIVAENMGNSDGSISALISSMQGNQMSLAFSGLVGTVDATFARLNLSSSSSNSQTILQSGPNSQAALQLTGDAKALYPDALAGDSYAQAYIGVSYYLGDEAPEIESEALFWLMKSAEQGDAFGMSTLGAIYITDPDYQNIQEGINLVYMASEKEAEFSSTLARFLFDGEIYGIPRDIENAFLAAERGATVGDPDAMAILAFGYATGSAGIQDEEYAFELALEAEEYGSAFASAVLSWLYCNGSEQDLTKAVEYAQIASDAGDAFGMGQLALYLWAGEGIKQNYKQAYELAEESAMQANEIGQYVMGLLYANGNLVNQDLILAWAYFDMSARKDFAEAETLRDMVAEDMTPREVKKAQEYVQLWRQQWGLGTTF